MTFLTQSLRRNINLAKQNVALEVHRQVIVSTPVDTGKARSNWQASVGAEIDTEINPYAPGNRLGIGETANAAAAIAQGQSVIPTALPGQEIAISNNVYYIGLLNDGTSAQAPENFVQIAVEAGLQKARDAKVIG
jgi:hypothetical protein